MSFSPNATEILEITSNEFTNRLLPHIPPSERHTALMVRHALNIALRMLRDRNRDGSDKLSSMYTDFKLGGREPGTESGRSYYIALLDDCRNRVAITNPRRLMSRIPLN